MGTRPAAEGEVNGPCAGTKFLRFYTAHIPNSFMGPLGGEIGITVVLIYRTGPDATEQPAGALPTIEAPTTVSGAPAPNCACGRVPGDDTSSDRSPLGLRALPSRELARYR